MNMIISAIVSIVGDVVRYFIFKWLDRNSR